MIEIAPGIRRKKPVRESKFRSSYSFEMEKKIVKDYYVNALSSAEIEEKYNKTSGQVKGLICRWENLNTVKVKEPEPIDPPQIKEQIIIVEDKDMEFLYFLLDEWQIDYRIPENFELIEKYESKLNY